MGLVLGELSVVLDANASKFKGAFDGAGKSLDKFRDSLRLVDSEAVSASKGIGAAMTAANKNHFDVAMRSTDQLSQKMGVLNKTTYTTSDAWKRMGVWSLANVANFIRIADAVLDATQAIFRFGVAVAKSLFSSLVSAADAAAQEQAGLDALEAQLARTGSHGAGVAAERFNEFAASMQRATRFSDDQIVAAGALAAAMAAPHAQLERITMAAADFATGTGKSLEESITAIMKAAHGQGKGLQQAGIAFDAARLKAEGLNYALALVEGRFGGRSEQAAQNYEGRLIRLGHGFDDLVEKIGGFVESNPYINAAIEVVIDKVRAFTDWIGRNSATINTWVNRVLGGVKILGYGVAVVFDRLLREWHTLIGGLDLVVAAMLSPLRLLLDGLGGVVTEIAVLVAKLAATPMGKSLGLTSGLAQDLARAGSEVSSFGDDLQNAFLEEATAHATMLEKMVKGEAGLAKLWSDFTDEIERRAKAIKNLPAPTGGATPDETAGEGYDFLDRIPESTMGGLSAKGYVRGDMSYRPTRDYQTLLENNFGADELGALKIGQGAVSGVAGSVMNAVTTARTPQEALANVGVALLTSSKQFQQIMAAINPLLQAFADLMGATLAPIREIAQPMAESLAELLQAVTPLLELFYMLSTPLIILQVAAEQLGRVIHWAASGILTAIIAFLKGIQRMAKKFHVHVGALDDAIDSLKNLRDGLDDAAGAATAAAEALYNVPEGFKIAAYRFEATTGMLPGGHGAGGGNLENDIGLVAVGGSSGSSGNAASSGGGDIYHSAGDTIYIEQLVALDPEQVFDEVDRVAKRRNIRRRGSPLSPPPGFFGGRK